MELRTYNLRDTSGLLVLATDDPLEAETFLAEHSDHRPDDFSKTDIRAHAKRARAQERVAERAEKQLASAASEREKAVKARAKELEDSKALARAVAEIEQRLSAPEEDTP